jgi:hypothetical protein
MENKINQIIINMKIQNYFKTSLVLFASASLFLVSCKSKKATSIEKENKSTEITVPFSSKEYYSDKETFRAKSNGNSIDLATAKKIASQNAKSEMAGMIQTTIKKVTDQYTQQRTVGDQQDFNNKFEELAREVTNQKLVDVKTIGEKLFKEVNGTYTYWIAIEASKQDILNGIQSNISNQKKLEQDYDKKKFEEIFNSEMDKLQKERDGN